MRCALASSCTCRDEREDQGAHNEILQYISGIPLLDRPLEKRPARTHAGKHFPIDYDGIFAGALAINNKCVMTSQKSPSCLSKRCNYDWFLRNEHDKNFLMNALRASGTKRISLLFLINDNAIKNQVQITAYKTNYLRPSIFRDYSNKVQLSEG